MLRSTEAFPHQTGNRRSDEPGVNSGFVRYSVGAVGRILKSVRKSSYLREDGPAAPQGVLCRMESFAAWKHHERRTDRVTG